MSEDPVAGVSAAPKRKPTALGRGLGALLGETRREEPLVVAPGKGADDQGKVSEGLALLPVGAIEPHPEQPRRHFDDAALDELAASIAARGVIQPVIVRPHGPGRWQLIAGERRWRAAQRAQLHEIPAIVRELSERDVMALALIENLQREDLNPIEEARAYQRLADSESMTQAEIARMVDKSRSHVANLQRLLSLPEPVIEMVEDGRLSMGHARALIGVEDAAAVAQNAVERRLSVREVAPGWAAPSGAGREPFGRDRGYRRGAEPSRGILGARHSHQHRCRSTLGQRDDPLSYARSTGPDLPAVDRREHLSRART